MNERIRLFAEQSNLAELYDRYVEYCMKNADDDIMDYDTIVKKFAELIVKECADIGQQYADGNYEVPNQILEYFGMQEPEE